MFEYKLTIYHCQSSRINLPRYYSRITVWWIIITWC